MRKRDVFIGAGLGSVAGLIVAPIALLLVNAVLGPLHALQVFEGALLAVGFFLVSAIVAAFYQNSRNLRTAMLMSYATKTGFVFAGLSGIQMSKSDAYPFGISVGVSALFYLFFQTAYIAKWRHKYRHVQRQIPRFVN